MRLCFRAAVALVLGGLAFGQQTSWTMEPAEAALGEPTRWRLDVLHDAADTVIGGPEDFVSGGARVLVLDGPYAATVPAPGLDGRERARTSLSWTVIGVEPGEALGPELAIELESGLPLEWGGEAADAVPGGLRVRGELGPDEDQPRDLPAAPGWEGLTGSSGRSWPFMAGALALVAGAAGFWFVRRRAPRPEPQAPAGPAPRARLTALIEPGEAAQDGRGNAGARAKQVGFEVGAALRAAVEERTGATRPGHAAHEWLLDQDAAGLALPPEGREELERLLLRADDLKFGPAEGRLGQRDLVQRALALLGPIEALAPASGASSQAAEAQP